MLKANTEIIVGNKTFQEGQEVTGLSAFNVKWMKEQGYISDVPKAKEEKQNDV